MLIVSVIVIGVVAAAYAFVPTFRSGVNALASDVASILDTGMIGGVGKPRDGGGMYNTASNNAQRCVDQKNDPRYAAMFDPPACIEDPAPTPAPLAPALATRERLDARARDRRPVVPLRAGDAFRSAPCPPPPMPFAPAGDRAAILGVIAPAPERRARRRNRRTRRRLLPQRPR